jgi:hypothetical protein
MCRPWSGLARRVPRGLLQLLERGCAGGLCNRELPRITLPETVWKLRLCSNRGFTRPRNEGGRSHFGALRLAKEALSDPSSEFLDSLSTLDFSHWAAMQTASLQVPRMPLRLFAGRCRYPTRKKSPKPSRAEIASFGAHEEEDGTRRPNRTAIGPRQAALGVTD